MLILHITCVLVSVMQNECSTVYQYFSEPQKCMDNCILGDENGRTHQVFQDREYTSGSSPLTCSCGLRIMFSVQANNTCPFCKNKEHLQEHLSMSAVSTKKHNGWDVSLPDMSPSVFHALHFIIHASLYSGVAMGISSKDDLSLLLGRKNAGASETTQQYQNPVTFCFDQLKTDLKRLTTILTCKKEIAAKVMHLVVEKSADLLTGKVINNVCLTPEQRHRWEVKFSNIVKDVFPKAMGPAKELHKMGKDTSKENTIIEDKIQELDDYPVDPTQQNQELKRLFRVTRQPSFQEFHSIFINASKGFQTKHSFLCLFFATFNQLSKIGHLFHLLKWTRFVASALTHRISRKDAESRTIEKFINDNNRSQDETESLKGLFDKFQEAWDEVRHLVNQELDQDKKMPCLEETDPIGYCLIESNSGIYLVTAIKLLVSLQNSILDEMIWLSATQQHPALQFLEKGNNISGTSSVSIQNASEKDIINFKWSDDLFITHAQSNLEYGQGEQVHYDFERIETILAKRIAFGKCYLVFSLNKFIFFRELFHYSGPLIAEIREHFTQNVVLPDEVRQSLRSLKECRIQDAQNLLEHIEVLIFLMKQKLKSGVVDGEMTIEGFVDMMTAFFPSPLPLALLPEPRNSIKLKHVPALYEALEDLLADGAIKGLPHKFCDVLTEETKDGLNEIVHSKQGLERQTLLSALRRFVFRYLSSEKFLPEENKPLRSCLKEPSLWSPCELPNLDDISGDITLQHVHSVIKYLQDFDKGNLRKDSGKTHLKTVKRKTGKRRCAPNFDM